MLIKDIKLSDNKILKIYQDEHCSSPREDDNLGTMVCFHTRYTLGDKHDFSSPDEFKEEIKEKDNIILPLYLMDHSGLSMKCGPFGYPWDSGQVGWIYVSKEKLKKEFGDKRILKKKIEEYLENEVKAYDDYLRGNCYGFSLEKEITCQHCNVVSNEDIDSCWGFIGDIENCGILDQIQDSISPEDMDKIKAEL